MQILVFMNKLLAIRRELSLCKNKKNLMCVLSKFEIKPLYSFSKFYDIAYKGDRGDKDYYNKIVKNATCPLYIGVGTGRIFSRLWKINPGIQGLDRSIEMINGMLQTYPYINTKQLIIGDILTYKFSNKFDTVIAPFSFLTQFEFNDSFRILRSINRILSDDGVFSSDFYSPYDVPRQSDLQIGPVVRTKKFGSYFMVYCYSGKNTQLSEYSIVKTGDQILVLELKLFTYYPRDILRLFRMAGFSNVSISRGFSSQTRHLSNAPIVVSASKLGKKPKK